jgi:hypothetical protein
MALFMPTDRRPCALPFSCYRAVLTDQLHLDRRASGMQDIIIGIASPVKSPSPHEDFQRRPEQTTDRFSRSSNQPTWEDQKRFARG